MFDKGSNFDSFMSDLLKRRYEEELNFFPCSLVFPNGVHIH